MFPHCKLLHCTTSISDHCPLLLDTGVRTSPIRGDHLMRRFESCWLLEEGCEFEVKRLWEGSNAPIPMRIREVCEGLTRWAKTARGLSKATISQLHKRLSVLGDMDLNDGVLEEMISSKLHLNLEIDMEERYWEQRARVNWLRFGDRNTSFFYRFATQRRRVNRVANLQDASGRIVMDDDEIGAVACDYFSELFTSQWEGDSRHLLSGILVHITVDMNNLLRSKFTETDVSEAVRGMSPTKAVGSDRIPALFFQRFWHIVGAKVSAFCLSILNDGAPLGDINDTNIILIPKIRQPQDMTHFRPISLCTVLFKLFRRLLLIDYSKLCLFVLMKRKAFLFLVG